MKLYAVGINDQLYFSKMFKKELGINYIEWLTNYRMDIAKEMLMEGKEAIKAKFLDIQARKANYATARDVTNKEESLLTTLESAIEMTARGYKFSNIDLYRSDSKNFIVDHETKSLIPPFSAIDGLGEAAAKTVIEARKNGEFLSIEDLTQRTQLNGTNIKMLEKLGVLKDMQAKNQLELDLF